MSPRHADIFCVSNALLQGGGRDDATQWLVRELSALGVRVGRVLFLLPERELFVEEFRRSIGRGTEMLVTLGGLGPCDDDRTLMWLAAALERPFEISNEMLQMLQDRYEGLAQAGMVATSRLSECRRNMAFCPRGAIPLENKAGLAPGVFIETRQMTIIALPGEPLEARSVFEGNTLATRLKLSLAGLGYADEVVELESNDEASAIDIVKHVKMQHPGVVIAVRGGLSDHSPVLRLHLCAWTEEPEKPAGEAKPTPEFPRTGSRTMPSVGSGSKPMMTVTVAELESAGARTLRARARAQELIAHAIADLEQEVMSIRHSDDESRPEVKIGMRRRAPEYR
mgnify:CR=1 FL=1